MKDLLEQAREISRRNPPSAADYAELEMLSLTAEAKQDFVVADAIDMIMEGVDLRLRAL